MGQATTDASCGFASPPFVHCCPFDVQVRLIAFETAARATEGTPEGLNNAQAAQLQAWVGGRSSPSAWTEVYRASRDGFGAAAFHAGSDGKPRLLVLVREKIHGWLFGGFTEVGFIAGSDRHYADPAAFIFSLTNPACRPERLASMGSSNEVRYCPGDAACFGGGWVADLHIASQADSGSRSWTRPGTAFEASSVRGWHPMAAGWQRVYWSAAEVVAWTVPV